MKDEQPQRSPNEIADDLQAALKQVDALMKEATPLAVEQLDKKALREFRKAKRASLRAHVMWGDFVDDNVPDVTVLSGST